MVMTSWFYVILALIIAVSLYAYIDKWTKERNWGDAMQGMRAERARDALLKIDKSHVTNWWPHYLVIGAVNEKGEVANQGTLTLLK